MLVDAIYDNGRLVLPNHLSFAHHRFDIKVVLPDTEIITASTVKVGAPQGNNSSVVRADDYPEEYVKFMELRNAMFGDDYHYVQEKSDKEILLEVLCEKYT
jgi:hypothetical protein